MEDLTISVADHIQRVLKSNFAAAWQEFDADSEVEETYFLTKFPTIKENVDGLGPTCRPSRPMALLTDEVFCPNERFLLSTVRFFPFITPPATEMVSELLNHLGMQPCERSDQLPAEAKPSHTLLLSGVFRGGIPVLSRCRLAKSVQPETASGVNLQILVRSSVPEISQAIADSLS
ncbi:unnamed protein product [Dibothriocephalus latus]|uniref:Coatomer subunit gamma C-terminal domain-containing protein n=1 Tax=Dibothriocephalus latus TaxID=60516 RepID=A0A3P7P1V8_DIBLA|nr:unnamed protein product [Dibothriocephalus latus]